MKKNIAILGILFITLFMVGCASLDSSNKKSPYTGKSAQTIFSMGFKKMKAGNYDDAIKDYQAVEANYPYGKYTTQAQLNTIYCNYKLSEADAAVQSADHFIELHPSFPKLDYVYYMKGLTKMDQNAGFIQKILPMPLSERDVSSLVQSFLYFNQLVTLYPNSKFSPDARTRMIFLRNMIAKHQLYTAQFYYDKKAYLAAANRANLLIKHYEHAPSIPNGLLLLSKTYAKMSLPKLSGDIQEVFRINYKS